MASGAVCEQNRPSALSDRAVGEGGRWCEGGIRLSLKDAWSPGATFPRTDDARNAATYSASYPHYIHTDFCIHTCISINLSPCTLLQCTRKMAPEGDSVITAPRKAPFRTNLTSSVPEIMPSRSSPCSLQQCTRQRSSIWFRATSEKSKWKRTRKRSRNRTEAGLRKYTRKYVVTK